MALAARVGGGLTGPVQNRVLGAFNWLVSAERLVDFGLRTGPYGIRSRGPFGGLTMGKVKRARHGVDLGPLKPRLPGALRTRGKRVRLAPAPFVEEAGRLEALAAEREAALAGGFDLILIGRRQLRSNNSWLHNSARLMKGADRCTARLHPAGRRGPRAGRTATRSCVTSAVGSIELPLEVSDEMRPGVVSIPHGFGHHRDGVGWKRAAAKAGASVNDITDPSVVDRLTGNAAFNAVPGERRGAPIAGSSRLLRRVARGSTERATRRP